MIRSALATLACCVVVLYAVAFVVGLMVDGEQFFIVHFAIGFCAVVFTLLTHCVVMTYLIISGKMVRMAVEASGLDPDWIVQTKELKAQTFPFMIAAILLLLAAAFFGGAATDRPEFSPFHLIAAVLAAGYNTFTFVVAYQKVSRGSALTEEVLRQHNRISNRRTEGTTLAKV